MTYSQKYTIVQFLGETLTDVFSMEDWPLHITLADVFAIHLSDELLGDLSNLTASQNEISLGSGSDTISAVKIERTQELEALHRGLIDLLEQNGAVFNTPEYTRSGFLPHCTYQEGLRPQDKEVSFHELSLVDMFVENDWRKRKVIASFKLARY